MVVRARVNIYIAGIGGTLMAGIARLASERGDSVGGCDARLYAPMDEQLANLGVAVDIVDGDGAQAAQGLGRDAERVVIGNALSRGHPLVERVLRERQSFCSAPQWLRDEVLRERDVVAVAGTHGKTTTTSMLAWILSAKRERAGFLVGGVPVNMGVSARLGEGAFVIEADEYDTAFFDKRPKFLHYFPRVLVLNNLDYDHADIFADLAAIQTQFSYLLRTVSDDGKVIWNGDDANLREVMARGCWTPAESFGVDERADWRLLTDERRAPRQEDAHGEASWTFDFSYRGETMPCGLRLFGRHNALNALAAIAAAAQFGIEPRAAAQALASFRGVRRRLEVRARGENATVYDDFAHHPQAIRASLDGVRQYAGDARVVAVFEPRSNTMKLGCHNEQLADAFARADKVLCYTPPDWAGEAAMAAHADAVVCADEQTLWRALKADFDAADRDATHYIFMSNGRFFGLVDRLAAAVQAGSVQRGSTGSPHGNSVSAAGSAQATAGSIET